MNSIKDLAVQSYCFRGFKTNKEVIEKVKECGLGKIELCQAHVDFNDENNFENVVQEYKDAGINIVSIGVNRFQNDSVAEEKLFKFAKLAGCKVMSVDFTPDSVPESYSTAEKLADKYDINIGIHNHGARHWLGSVQILKTVLANTSPRIGLMLDTAWALDSGEDPLEMVESFKDRLYSFHLKDFVFDRAGKHEDVIVGTGNLDIPGLFKKLEKIEFKGEYILEYEADVENPVPALKECLSSIKKQLQ